MARSSALSVSLFALLAALMPLSAHATGENVPSTAFAVPGVANTVSSTTETAMMSRLRALRESGPGGALNARQPMRQPERSIQPLQDSSDTLYDLRGQSKTPHIIAGQSGTRMKMKHNFAMVEDSSSRPQQPQAIQTIERNYDKFIKFSSELGGGESYNKDRQSPSSRREIRTRLDSKNANGYPGQPLAGPTGGYLTPPPSAIENAAPTPLSGAAAYGHVSPPNLSSTPPSVTSSGVSSSLNVAPPVIYPPSRDTLSQTSDKERRRLLSLYAMVPRAETPSPNNLMVAGTSRGKTAAGSYVWNNEPSAPQGETKEMTTPQIGSPKLAEAAPTPAPGGETYPAPVIYGTDAIPAMGGSINADRRWGFFVTGVTGFGNAELQNNAAKAKTNTNGVTAGLDYRYAEKTFAGMAVTYVHGSFNTSGMGDLQSNSVALSLYGTTEYVQNAYLDGFISLGYNSLDSARSFAAGTAKTSPDGVQVTAKAETGYDMKSDGWTYGPFAGLRLGYADFGTFDETGPSSLALKVKGVDNFSAITALGGGLRKNFMMDNGGSVLLSGRLGYNHEFGDAQTKVTSASVTTPAASVTTSGAKRSRDWVNFTKSVAVALPNNWTFEAAYEHDFFRDDADEHIFNLGANYKW